MDLGAYAQIGDLEQLAIDNGIDIPRLRGYRLMKDEEKISQDEINRMKKNCEIEVVKRLCASRPFWSSHPDYHIYSTRTDYIQNYFLVKKHEEYVDIRWDRIHGWKRRVLKFEIKKQKRKLQQQYDIWNKYAGKDDVLYIHSRMGGANWKYYDDKNELMNQPWFLDRVDDFWDSTYCDFYAKIQAK